MTLPKSVNHPSHYGGEDNPYEAIKIIEALGLGFNLGNAIKYISRAGKKGSTVEDLQKAVWYLEREIFLNSPTMSVDTKDYVETLSNVGVVNGQKLMAIVCVDDEDYDEQLTQWEKAVNTLTRTPFKVTPFTKLEGLVFLSYFISPKFASELRNRPLYQELIDTVKLRIR